LISRITITMEMKTGTRRAMAGLKITQDVGLRTRFG
jgi:hypothetical protein